MRQQKKALADRKSRDAKRKAARLERERQRNVLGRVVKGLRADIQVAALSKPSEEKVVFGVVTGTYGSPGAVSLSISHESVVGINESNEELGTLVTNLGLLVLSALVRHNLAEGVDGLPKKLAAFAHVDLEALKREAESDAQEQPVPPSAEPEPEFREGVVL